MNRIDLASLFSCMLLYLVSGCSSPEWTEPFPERLTISVTDSIGMEMGDSLYVLGVIVDAGVTPSGEILLLDRSACRIRKYSPEGIHIDDLSRQGSGPGEFLFPMEMTVQPDGRIIVRDMMNNSLVVIDEDGEYISEMADWPMMPPSAITSPNTGHIAGCLTDFHMSGGNLALIFKPTLFPLEGEEQELPLFSDTLIVENVMEMPITPTGLQGYPITASCGDGRIFYSNHSMDSYHVRCWDDSGTLLYSFSMEMPPVEKTPEELEEETEFQRLQFAALGMNTLPEDFEPEPFHPFIVGLGVDCDGNLWIQRGTGGTPVFDIVDGEGVYIGTAEFPRTGHFWNFSITPYGSIGWNSDPVSGVQRLYILDLPSP